jgi:hypothetical protein
MHIFLTTSRLRIFHAGLQAGMLERRMDNGAAGWLVGNPHGISAAGGRTFEKQQCQ